MRSSHTTYALFLCYAFVIGCTVTHACTSELDWPGIRLVGANPHPILNGLPTGPIPLITADVATCRRVCSPYVGFTRQRSTKNCWCVNQPFGAGSSISANVDGDFDTGLNANSGSGAGWCTESMITGQKVMFGSGFSGPFSSTSNSDCSWRCGMYPHLKNMWTRQSSTGQCWCGLSTGAFQYGALQYDPDFAFGLFVAF